MDEQQMQMMQQQGMDPSQMQGMDPSQMQMQGGMDPSMQGMDPNMMGVGAPGAQAPLPDPEHHTTDTNLIYKTLFLTSELNPVQDVLIGRTLIKAVTQEFNGKDPLVIVSNDMKLLDGHHVWAGARLAKVEKICGLKTVLNFDTARGVLLKLSEKYNRTPEIDTTKDIYISELESYTQVVQVINKMTDGFRNKVLRFVEQINAGELMSRLLEIKNLAPVVGYKKERMPTFIRSKGDYQRIIEDFRAIKLEDDKVPDADFKWNTMGGGMM